MVKFNLSPKSALNQFLIQYRKTPLAGGYSPSERLNARQIRTTIDILIPSPAHQTQQHLNKQAVKATQRLAKRSCQQYKVGMTCYALYCEPKRDKDPRWVPAIVIKVYGPRCVAVRVYPKSPIWRRHVDQLRPRYGSVEDNEPGDIASGTRQSYSTVFEALQDSETSEKGTCALQQCVTNDQMIRDNHRE